MVEADHEISPDQKKKKNFVQINDNNNNNNGLPVIIIRLSMNKPINCISNQNKKKWHKPRIPGFNDQQTKMSFNGQNENHEINLRKYEAKEN